MEGNRRNEEEMGGVNLIFIQGIQTQDVKCILTGGLAFAPITETFKTQVLGRVHLTVAESSLRPEELFVIHIRQARSACACIWVAPDTSTVEKGDRG